ncbi:MULTISPECIES: 5-oxoprolinase subunit B family protein [Pseudonocardia]|uniref:Kinase A inhibitor n=2 Tax=Pseudonocardia TaxID=1847 RepID=A0A1Y2MI02_PSEAH|nr:MULTISPECIES: allophanate hydrolase subunit 1 [Pseudonocardia]OSY34915.1 Kinase A inhibitor [Pseudonocardia autotrophica]TDN76978.1 KipI family sensor histidine kinase inhibitor [Pseudonocardia autotrophica]BBG00982.1 hypothetical protein Pdca_21910 [Pseudonocardia autotrophica]GEC29123.1 hypothetical protein PSA01_61520 [Pseudonocardia saturnea]
MTASTVAPDPMIRPCGDAALLVEVGDLDAALDLHAALRAAPPSGVLDLVPAACSVLVRVRPGTDLRAVEQHIRGLGTAVGIPVGTSSDPVEIPAVYDGADLPAVAELLGRTPDEVVALHANRVWVVAFVGFAPGFGYLAGGDDWFDVPRRAVPRTAVPPGSIALAGRYSGVYPRESPGGWQLIGRTDLRVWDLDRRPPALLVPGARVRFVPVGRP